MFKNTILPFLYLAHEHNLKRLFFREQTLSLFFNLLVTSLLSIYIFIKATLTVYSDQTLVLFTKSQHFIGIACSQ